MISLVVILAAVVAYALIATRVAVTFVRWSAKRPTYECPKGMNNGYCRTEHPRNCRSKQGQPTVVDAVLSLPVGLLWPITGWVMIVLHRATAYPAAESLAARIAAAERELGIAPDDRP